MVCVMVCVGIFCVVCVLLLQTEEPVVEQTEFTVKLVRFAPESKVKVIKEVKSLIEGLNLVQVRRARGGRASTHLSQAILRQVGEFIHCSPM